MEGADPVEPALDGVAGGGPEVVLEALDPRPGDRHALEREPRGLAAALGHLADERDGRVLAVDVAALVRRALEVELGDVARGEPALPVLVRDDDQEVDVRRRAREPVRHRAADDHGQDVVASPQASGGAVDRRAVMLEHLGHARPASTSSARVRPASRIRSSWSSNQTPW